MARNPEALFVGKLCTGSRLEYRCPRWCLLLEMWREGCKSGIGHNAVGGPKRTFLGTRAK